jgi:cell volume regulation protein A
MGGKAPSCFWTPPDIELSDTIKTELTEIVIDDTSRATGKRILDLGFPRAALIALIKRKGSFVTPNGSTVIEPGDVLVIVAENAESLRMAHEVLGPREASETG